MPPTQTHSKCMPAIFLVIMGRHSLKWQQDATLKMTKLLLFFFCDGLGEVCFWHNCNNSSRIICVASTLNVNTLAFFKDWEQVNSIIMFVRHKRKRVEQLQKHHSNCSTVAANSSNLGFLNAFAGVCSTFCVGNLTLAAVSV